jgi:hypothetical protein
MAKKTLVESWLFLGNFHYESPTVISSDSHVLEEVATTCD